MPCLPSATSAKWGSSRDVKLSQTCRRRPSGPFFSFVCDALNYGKTSALSVYPRLFDGTWHPSCVDMHTYIDQTQPDPSRAINPSRCVYILLVSGIVGALGCRSIRRVYRAKLGGNVLPALLNGRCMPSVDWRSPWGGGGGSRTTDRLGQTSVCV